MMGSSSSPSAAADALALLSAAAAAPETLREQLAQLVAMQQSISDLRSEAMTAEANARTDREATEALKRDIEARETAMTARENDALKAAVELKRRNEDLVSRETIFAAESKRRSDALKTAETAVSLRESNVKSAENRAAAATTQADALRIEWSEKVEKLRSFIATL